MTDYDPADFALLVCGWTQGAAETGRADELTIARALELENVARMLSRLYTEVQDEWGDAYHVLALDHVEAEDAIWAYEVVEPLGVWIGRAYGRDGTMPPLAEIETAARAIVEKQQKRLNAIERSNYEEPRP